MQQLEKIRKSFFSSASSFSLVSFGCWRNGWIRTQRKRMSDSRGRQRERRETMAPWEKKGRMWGFGTNHCHCLFTQNSIMNELNFTGSKKEFGGQFQTLVLRDSQIDSMSKFENRDRCHSDTLTDGISQVEHRLPKQHRAPPSSGSSRDEVSRYSSLTRKYLSKWMPAMYVKAVDRGRFSQPRIISKASKLIKKTFGILIRNSWRIFRCSFVEQTLWKRHRTWSMAARIFFSFASVCSYSILFLVLGYCSRKLSTWPGVPRVHIDHDRLIYKPEVFADIADFTFE